MHRDVVINCHEDMAVHIIKVLYYEFKGNSLLCEVFTYYLFLLM